MKIKLHFKYKQKLMIIFLCLIFVPFALIVGIYFSSLWKGRVDNILNDAVSGFEAGIERINNLYLGSLGKIEHIKYNVMINGILKKDYTGKYDELVNDYLNIKYIMYALNSEAARNDQHYRINIFAFNDTIGNGEYIKNINAVDEPGGIEAKIKEEMLASEDNIPIWKFTRTESPKSIQRESISLYEKLAEVNEPLAIIEIKISMARIKQELDFDMPEGSFLIYFVDRQTNIVIGENNADKNKIEPIIKKYLDSGHSDGFYSISRRFKVNAHEAVLFVDKVYVLKKMTGFILLTIGIILFLMTTLLVIARLISYSLTRRLSDLIAKINVEDDIWIKRGEVLQLKGNDEFAVISFRFMELAQRIRDYFGRISSLEIEKKMMEVEMLQAGINPHFLYNTLSVIKWAYEDEKLEKIIDSMVKYYRIMLNRGNMVLKLEQELEMVREYIEIQKFAYRKEFSYTIRIEGECGECMILKNLLQPVVENAILHGINSLDCGGSLLITCETAGERLVLTVSDNGTGMSAEKVEQVLRGESEQMYGGYGITNVIKRIKMHYGDEYGMEIDSRPGEGTTVKLFLPLAGNNKEKS